MQTRDYVMEVNLLVPLKGAKGKKNTSMEVVFRVSYFSSSKGISVDQPQEKLETTKNFT